MIRGLFRLAVLVSLLTVASLMNTALSWHLPLPDLIPDSQPAPPCVLPGSPTAYGQPAGFGALVPDLPSAMGKIQGQLLHKLDGPPPSQAQIHAAASAVGHGMARWASSLRAAAKGRQDPASVTAYQTRQRAAYTAHQVTSCNPCQPQADGSTKPYNQARYTTTPGLDAQQRANAATIITIGKARRVPARGQVVAIATALQESRLRNLNHGDRDSLGVFQQRASWGPVAERMDVATAAAKFYAALGAVPGWDGLPVTVAAQKVQRSAYPDAYAQWEGQASAIVTGSSVQPVAGGMQCASFTSTYKTGAGFAWGGYTNGRIPPSALTHPRSAPTASFRADAAAAFDRLSAAYAARFGRPIAVTDSYRSYAGQVACRAAKGNMCAEVGTSNHGWGLAADLQVGGYGDARYMWMRANAPRYGWDNPTWARPGGSKHEPWHWEFNPTGSAT